MNLIVRITILFVFVSLVVFLIGGTISYKVMMREVEYEQQRFLIERLERMERRLERRPPRNPKKWTKLSVTPLEGRREEVRIFSDTLVMHSQLDRLETHLKLEAIKNVHGKSYLISLYDIIIEPDDIRDGLVESLAKMYLILLGSVLIVGFGASYYILRPFNLTLSIIRKFSLKDTDQKVYFPKSKVAEFKRLNQFLTEMTEKVQSDYRSLKEFSENASHEFQTPIAVIQSKLEVLMDGENISEEQMEQLHYIQNAMHRLSSLSNSLALLTKIENKEFVNVKKLKVSQLLAGQIEELRELFELKKISTDIQLKEGVELEVDKILLEVMFTNLINNAIRHNWENGQVRIELSSEYFKVSNTGPELLMAPDDLFERFKKSNQSSKSMGLGLAIVKKICDHYGFESSYSKKDELHTIQITFEPLKRRS